MTAYVNKSLLYTGYIDSRSCGPCTCNAVDGGTCFNIGLGTASQITVYGASNCGTGSGVWADITLDICSVYNGSNSTLTANPASVTYMPTITHGDCSGGVASPPRPDGGVTPTGPTTICCM
jgi:hypothetical protein